MPPGQSVGRASRRVHVPGTTLRQRQLRKARWFLIAPVGPEGSPERRRTAGLLDCIGPLAKAHDATLVASHLQYTPQSITQEILTALQTSELVIADLTDLRANCLFEVGIRHALGLPMVLLAVAGTSLPFDLQDMRTLFYRDDLRGWQELSAGLARAIEASVNRR